jgi:hypothetical protein
VLSVVSVALHGASKRKCGTCRIMHSGAVEFRVVWSGVFWVSGISPSRFSNSINFDTEIKICALHLSFVAIKGSEV